MENMNRPAISIEIENVNKNSQQTKVQDQMTPQANSMKYLDLKPILLKLSQKYCRGLNTPMLIL